MALTDSLTRVTITIPGHTVDVAMATDQTIAHIVADVVPFLKNALDGNDDAAEAFEWLSDPRAIWQLGGPLGVHYAGDKTPAGLGLADGSVLQLLKSEQRENYAPLIDDLAESIAHYQKKHFAAWDPTASRRLAAITAPVASFGLVVAVLFGSWNAGVVESAQLAIAAVMGLVGMSAIAAAAVGIQRTRDESLRSVAGSSVLAGYIALAGSALLVIPGEPSVYSGLVAGAVLLAASIVVQTTVGYPEKINYAAGVAGVSTILGSLLAMGVSKTGLMEVSGFIAVVAFAALRLTDRIALVLAKIPAPFVPTAGETFINDDSEDVSTVQPGQGSAAIASIINQEKEAVGARNAIVGLTWGGLVPILLSAFLAGLGMVDHVQVMAVLFGALSMTMIFSGKSNEDSVIQLSFLAAAPATFGLFLIGGAFGGGSYSTVVWGAGVLAVAVAIGCWVAVVGKRINSPVIMRIVELFEWICFASPVVLIILMIDAFQMVRFR